MSIRKNENNNSKNIYRDMMVMLPLLKRMSEVYKSAKFTLIVRKYADYFKK